MKTGTELIADERQSQLDKHGWTPDHDDNHKEAEIAYAAEAYLKLAKYQANPHIHHVDALLIRDMYWPWGDSWWKPSDDPIKNLTRAGALIAAEIDRLQRAKQ